MAPTVGDPHLATLQRGKPRPQDQEPYELGYLKWGLINSLSEPYAKIGTEWETKDTPAPAKDIWRHRAGNGTCGWSLGTIGVIDTKYVFMSFEGARAPQIQTGIDVTFVDLDENLRQKHGILFPSSIVVIPEAYAKREQLLEVLKTGASLRQARALIDQPNRIAAQPIDRHALSALSVAGGGITDVQRRRLPGAGGTGKADYLQITFANQGMALVQLAASGEANGMPLAIPGKGTIPNAGASPDTTYPVHDGRVFYLSNGPIIQRRINERIEKGADPLAAIAAVNDQIRREEQLEKHLQKPPEPAPRRRG